MNRDLLSTCFSPEVLTPPQHELLVLGRVRRASGCPVGNSEYIIMISRIII